MEQVKKILGVPIHDIPIDKVWRYFNSGTLNGKVIVTPNVDHVVRFNRDKDFSVIYSLSDIYLNDSRVLRILSSFLEESLDNVVPGSELTEYFFENIHNSSDKRPYCILGAEERDVRIIEKKYSIEKIFHYSPPFGFLDSEDEIDKCVDFCLSIPDAIYFISVGSPRQEILAQRLKAAKVKGVFLCVGASVLFLSGREKRAPKIFQMLSVEWLYRLVQSPRRLFRRYVIEGPFIFFLLIKYIFKVKKEK